MYALDLATWRGGIILLLQNEKYLVSSDTRATMIEKCCRNSMRNSLRLEYLYYTAFFYMAKVLQYIKGDKVQRLLSEIYEIGTKYFVSTPYFVE